MTLNDSAAGKAMRLKCLFLSGCAALVAVSGARAADPVIAEPEPIEYVRICDAYGSGWFYLPGTETCLKIDGDLRADWGQNFYHDEQPDETSVYDDRFRARVNFRANNETEYGTAQSRIRIKAQYNDPKTTGTGGSHDDQLSVIEGPNSSSAPFVIDHATLSLAGFTVGFFDNFWKRAGNDGWYTSLTRFEGPYGNYQGLFLEYTYSAGGLNATVGMEDGNISGEAGSPDPYAGLTYTSGGLYLAGIAYYDSSQSAPAYKVRADYDFGASWAGFKAGGWYMWDDGLTDYVKGSALGLTSQVNLAEKWILMGGYALYDNQFFDSGECTSSCQNNSGTQWMVGLQWEAAERFFIIPQYQSNIYEQETAKQQNYGAMNLRVVRQF
jgi:hypothetical protein